MGTNELKVCASSRMQERGNEFVTTCKADRRRGGAFAFILTVGILSSCECAAGEQNCLGSVYRDSIADIGYSAELGKPDSSAHWKGALLSDSGLVVTANPQAFIEGSVPAGDGRTVRLGPRSSSREAVVQMKSVDEDALQFLVLEQRVLSRNVIKVGDEQPSVGDEVKIVSVSEDGDPETHVGVIRSLDADVQDQRKEWWLTSASLKQSDSGSPVFGKLGTLTGIAIVQGDADRVLHTYVVPIQPYLPELQSYGIQKVPFASCAQFPRCRNADHGVERFLNEAKIAKDSGWMRDGINQQAFCERLRVELTKSQPEAQIVALRSYEQLRREGIFKQQRSFRYFCEFLVRKDPIYKLDQGPECLPQ